MNGIEPLEVKDTMGVPLLDLALKPDHSMLAAAMDDGNFTLYSLYEKDEYPSLTKKEWSCTFRIVRSISVARGPVTCLTFGVDEEVVFAATSNSQVIKSSITGRGMFS